MGNMREKLYIRVEMLLFDEARKMNRAYNVDWIARQLGVSGPNLARAYKRETGETLKERLRRANLNNAHHMIYCRPDLSIEKIARHVGYESVSHFTRIFKEHHGETPVGYVRDTYDGVSSPGMIRIFSVSVNFSCGFHPTGRKGNLIIIFERRCTRFRFDCSGDSPNPRQPRIENP
jgi:AraC-like DNA-binding protein